MRGSCFAHNNFKGKTLRVRPLLSLNAEFVQKSGWHYCEFQIELRVRIVDYSVRVMPAKGFSKFKVMDKQTKKPSMVEMSLVHCNAAGIDIGDTFHIVAVPPDRCKETVKKFGTFTCDLQEIVRWLRECKIETVAMESTGVYWKNIFSVLIENGFDAHLVNARHAKNISGRKTDESDAQWIQRLHSCGLLRSGFLPDNFTDKLRTLVRHRKKLTDNSSSCILRMQKSLELMNIKIHTLISDITGKSGLAIIEAIVAGERDPTKFLPLLHYGIKANRDEIVKSLQGNWREEHLFTLEQSYSLYQFIQNQICSLDDKTAEILRAQMEANDQWIEPEIEKTPTGRVSKKKKSKHQLPFNVKNHLQQIHKVDVLQIYGLNEISALQILAETGPDLSKWETPEKYVAWLNLCPNRKITGGKVIGSKIMKQKPNLASQAFRMSANGVAKSNHWLGDYFRRMKSKGGQKFAIVAVARKLALIYYQMIRYKQAFTPYDLGDYQQKVKQFRITRLERALEKLKKEAA